MKKEKRNKININNPKIIRMIVFIITFIICLFADIKFEISFDSLNDAVAILYSALVTIAGIWVTCYLLFLQLYKDKYPIEIIKDTYTKIIKSTFLDVIYALTLGAWALLYGGAVSSSWFCIVSFGTIVQVLYYVYSSNKSLMTETHIKHYCDQICRDLESVNNTISEDSLRKIKNILDECILKNEYRTVSIIVKSTSDIYISFLENAIKLSREEAKEKLETTFERIVNLNLYQLKCCLKIKSETIINSIIKQQYKNLKYCIDNKLYEYFKIYLEDYCRYVYKMQTDGNDMLIDKFYTVFANIHIDLLECDNCNEYTTFVTESVESMISSLVFSDKNSNTKGYFKYLTSVILEVLDKEQKALFYEMLDKLKHFSHIVLRNKNAFENLKVYYTILFHKILEKDPNLALAYFEGLYNTSIASATDSTFIEFELMCIDELNDKLEAEDKKEHLLKIHIEVIQEIIKLKSDYTGGLLLPNFKHIIINCQYSSKDEMAKKVDLVKKLLNSCILHDNVAAFYVILDKIVDVFSETESRQKDLQEQLFTTFFWLVRKCNSVINEQFQEVTLSALRETVEKMDRNRSVSKGMAKYLVGGLHRASENDIMSGNKMVLKIIDFFFALFEQEEQISFITNHAENKMFVYKILFNIGTDCIENNFEAGIRKVSNSLGWLTIYCLRNKEFENAKYIIERALMLFQISKKMLVSEKTLTFILTLFTTVGTFCCKEAAYFPVRKMIINGIKTENFDTIETAIQLRTSENEEWNELFENKTQALTASFIEEFKKAQQ